MKMNFRKVVLFTCMAGGTILASCGGEGFGTGGATGGVAALTCPELRNGGMSGTFTADARANATMKAFVTASGDLAVVADRVEVEVTEACMRMGRDLGLTDAEMAPREGAGGHAGGACGALSAKVDAILKQGASASVKVSYTPPKCNVSADAYASCAGQCNVSVDPGYVVAHCDPGQLSGTCEGTCNGSCEGACNGDCQGECSAKNAQGQCAGTCKGTCHGTCGATCHAQCQGTWKAPHCAVQVKAPSADAHCDASCKAHASFTAQCTEPKVNAQASLNAGQIPQLVATLEKNLPALIRAELAFGERIGGDIKVLVQVGGDLPNALGEIGAHAGACIAASANAVVQAQASISVSVQASASISGKVGAHAGG